MQSQRPTSAIVIETFRDDKSSLTRGISCVQLTNGHGEPHEKICSCHLCLILHRARRRLQKTSRSLHFGQQSQEDRSFWMGLRHIWRPFRSFEVIQAPCRHFSGCQSRSSGHSRWSKIKHDKGKIDATKSRVRTHLSHDIIMASRREIALGQQ